MAEEETIRRIIREELSTLLGSDRYTFQKNIQIFDGRDIQLAKGVGTKIGTETTQKLGFYNKTPIVQPSSTGATSGFTSVGGDAVLLQSTFTGAEGSTAYTIGDIVKHLKLLGLIKL